MALVHKYTPKQLPSSPYSIQPGQVLPPLTCKDQQHIRTSSLAPPQCQQLLACNIPPHTPPQTPQPQGSVAYQDELPSAARVPPDSCLLRRRPSSPSTLSDPYRHTRVQVTAAHQDELPSAARVQPVSCLLCHHPSSLSRLSDHQRHTSAQVTAAHQDEQPSAARLPASSCLVYIALPHPPTKHLSLKGQQHIRTSSLAPPDC